MTDIQAPAPGESPATRDDDAPDRVRNGLLVALACALAVLVLHALSGLLAEVHYQDVVDEIAAMPSSRLLWAVLATAASYLALTGYDSSALRYAGATVGRGTVMLTAFIAYALSNTVGLGVLTGGAVRLRLYSAAGVEAQQVAQAVGFNAVAFGVGMTTFGAMGLAWGAPALATTLGVPALLLEGAAALTLAGMLAFVLLCRQRRSVMIHRHWQLELPPAGLVLRQLLISGFDLAFAAAALWCLLPDGAVPLPSFVAYYVVGIALGVLSHVPGGLGVFEAVILLACAGRVPAEQVAGALVIYRVIYYLLPLAVAVLMLAAYELRSGAAAPFARAAVRMLPAVLASVTVMTGVALLMSGMTPLADDVAELQALHVPLPLVEAAHLFGSIVGLALLFIARGLFHRLDAAWWAALVLVLVAGVLAVPKGVNIGEALALLVCASLLVVTRRQFERRSSLFEQSFEPLWWLCVATVLGVSLWMLLFAYQDVEYAHELWWQFEFDAHAPRSLRALMAVAVIALALALGQLFRVARLGVGGSTAADLNRALAVLERQSSADAYLALMGDKQFLFSDSGEAFIMYGQRGRSWIALFDPVGPQREWAELVWRFKEMAHARGGRAAFYQVRPQTLPIYLDAGLRVYKLGEEAHVPLAEFSLKGPRRANLRHGVNRAEREGLTFEVIPCEQVPHWLPALRVVSDAWLNEHDTQEKGFSLGAFDEAYLARQSVAVVKRGEQLVAFASLLHSPQNSEATLDLMRHLPDAPNGTMDFLFVRLLLHFQAQGFERFGLGMAPMSGMIAHPLATRWHRLGRLVFEHGERFYNFRGLRSFKDKFEPVWEPRYLAAPGGIAPLLALTDTAALISGGLRGIISKG
ncbi:MAG: bifunctional lysylphosphatidylglycerol flippase/synthetase MprF [Gammaproteobacteria bacterium]|nr:bifunctional lysylphosphatidylglycerol flippase/synthetase MprF [Gammaproteobacteria bacterium]